jgi:N-acetylglutamate synthase
VAGVSGGGRVRLTRDLTPADVGSRVMLRRALPGGGYGDVLGELLRWSAGRLLVRTRTGVEVEVAERAMVAGKRIPPAPHRVPSPDRLQEIAGMGWRPVEEAWLGRWWLRAAEGFTDRANSVVPLGDPGMPLEEALGRVRSWYAARDLPALATVVTGSALDGELAARGWTPTAPSFSHLDVLVQTAPLAAVLPRLAAADGAGVSLAREPDDAWLGLYRAGELPPVARRVIAHPDARFARVERDGTVVAIGRTVVVGRWAGLSAVEVAPGWRRRGLARAVMAALLQDAAGRGAQSVYLQVADDNAVALALYADLGFTTSHAYRYRRAPAGQP